MEVLMETTPRTTSHRCSLRSMTSLHPSSRLLTQVLQPFLLYGLRCNTCFFISMDCSEIWKYTKIFSTHFFFLIPGWKPRRTYKISIVSQIISKTAPRIFPKLGMKLGIKNVRNVARPLFCGFCSFSPKPLNCAEKR